MEKRKILRCGYEPSGENWVEDEWTFEEPKYGGVWRLYITKYKPSDQWFNFKVAFDGYKPGSANLQIGYDRVGRKIAKSKSVKNYFDYESEMMEALKIRLSRISADLIHIKTKT